MANIVSFDSPLATLPRPKVLAATAEHTLALVAPGVRVVVSAVTVEPEMAAWLDAVGIGPGEELTVLRRAAFGGPVHVRTRAGGEFAVARSLAAAIVVRREPGA